MYECYIKRQLKVARYLGIHARTYAYNPSDIRSRKQHVARAVDSKQVLYREVETDGMPSGVADNALWLPGGSAGVDDVERIGAGDWHRCRFESSVARAFDEALPVALAVLFEHGVPALLVALPYDGPRRLEGALLDGFFDQGLPESTLGRVPVA